ncbi:hypothetical protein AR691_14190 [Bacillus amyloliquefaciens]|nr:hypothetical protein AR691_14190 [Bacillus amyloliquefaciens]
MFVHETKKEYAARERLFVKCLRYTGCLKLVENQYSYQDKLRYDCKLRVVHPISWLIIILNLIVYGVNGETIRDIKKDLVFW